MRERWLIAGKHGSSPAAEPRHRQLLPRHRAEPRAADGEGGIAVVWVNRLKWRRGAGAGSSELEAHFRTSPGADAVCLRRGTEEFHACPNSSCACRRGSQRLGPSCRGRAGWPCGRCLFAVRHAHQRPDEAPSHAASLDVADPAAIPRRKLRPKQDARRNCRQQRRQWGDRQLRCAEREVTSSLGHLAARPVSRRGLLFEADQAPGFIRAGRSTILFQGDQNGQYPWI